MFDDNQEPKDMFADVQDPAAAPKPAVPASAQETPVAGVAAEEPILQQTQQSAPQPQNGGASLRLVVIVAISLACMGAAGYVAYRFMVRDAVSQQVSEVIGGNAETPNEETLKDADAESSPDKGEETPSSDLEETDNNGPTAVVDSDGDGLSNDEEREAGTSVAKPDTDSDGLGDREEVKVYDTDPKKADTDGDGYSDGDEIDNGYNPNGEGRLLQIPE